MKTGTAIALATLGATSTLALPASAQSGVTLSGIVDLAARQVRNDGVGSLRSLVSGSNSTSRLVFRGIEDLGDGLSASFHLEAGIAADTGSSVVSNQFFDRRSTVSLASRSLGEIRLGRDFVPTYVNWSRYDPFVYVGAAGSNNMVSATPLGPIRSVFGSNPNTTVRSSNAIQYLLPAGIGGVEGGLMVAAGEGGAVANGTARVVAGRLGYAAGPFGVSAAITQSENSLAVAGRFKDVAVGGNYDAGLVKLTAAWRQFKYVAAKQTNILVGAVVPIGVGEIKLSWNRANLAGAVGSVRIDANDADQIGLGGVYNLSKRSALYATLSRIDNKGVATYVVPGGPAGIAVGGRSTGLEAGLRHNF